MESIIQEDHDPIGLDHLFEGFFSYPLSIHRMGVNSWDGGVILQNEGASGGVEIQSRGGQNSVATMGGGGKRDPIHPTTTYGCVGVFFPSGWNTGGVSPVEKILSGERGKTGP